MWMGEEPFIQNKQQKQSQRHVKQRGSGSTRVVHCDCVHKTKNNPSKLQQSPA